MEWACPCRKSKSVGPFVYDRGVRCEIEDDGSIFDATGQQRFPIYISRQSYGMIVVETETAMRYIQAHRATYGRCNCKRTVRIHSCKCECRCNKPFRRKNKQKCHESKSIDQATQIQNTKTIDIAIQVDSTQKIKETPDRQVSSETEKELSHELTIPDSSVSVLRDFLSQNADEQVLTKFDSDEQFRSKLLYKLQPLVHVERSPQIKELMLKRFAEGLGLKHVADVRQDSIDRCTCKCPDAWEVPKEKDQHNGLDAITYKHKQRHKAKLVDQTTQVIKTKIDSAVQADTTKRTFIVRRKDRRVLRVLVISESNLTMLSRFLGSVKFNTDDRFRTHILHKLNPLVHLERCPEIEEMMMMMIKGVSTTESSLQVVKNARKDRVDRTKKGKVTKPKVFRLDKKTRGDKENVSSKRQNSANRQKSNSREYTPLEDAAIVRWISVGGATRERKVNGNQIWKQLQEEYSVLSGQERSWHSLRNRYLRYILPTLQRRGDVATAVATRLRAHAAMGQAKPAPEPAKESVRTVSAWAIRPRTPRVSHTPNDSRDPLNPPSRRRPLFNPRSVID